MDIQMVLVPMAMIYFAVIAGILGLALYTLILLIKALKIYIRKNS